MTRSALPVAAVGLLSMLLACGGSRAVTALGNPVGNANVGDAGVLSGPASLSFPVDGAGFVLTAPCCDALPLPDGGYDFLNTGPDGGYLIVLLTEADLSSACSGAAPLVGAGTHALALEVVAPDAGVVTATTYAIGGDPFEAYAGAGALDLLLAADGGATELGMATGGSVTFSSVGDAVIGALDLQMGFPDGGAAGEMTGSFTATSCPSLLKAPGG